MVFFLFAAAVFIFGLLIGSFLNVLVLRHGFRETPRARSGCMACGKNLAWWELMPVFSFILLRGRCAKCGSAISFQYPLVEFVLATLFLGTFLSVYPFSSLLAFVQFPLLLVFWASFVLLVTYDMKHTLVPLPFAAALVGSATLIRIAEAYSVGALYPLFDALWGALLFGGFLLFLFLVTRGRGMGFGDVYVGVALGILFGLIQSFEVAALSFWIGAFVGVLLLALKRGVRMKTEVPFVPFLFLGAVIGFFTNFSPLAVVGVLMGGL